MKPLWRRPNHRGTCTKFTGPLLPHTGAQAAAWLGGLDRLRLGFVTLLLRKGEQIVVKHQGAVSREWTTANA